MRFPNLCAKVANIIVDLGSSVLSCRRAQCVVWVVGPQYKSYACSAPRRASVVHTGRLGPLGTAYCALYVYMCLWN